jgi:hypothetical protein
MSLWFVILVLSLLVKKHIVEPLDTVAVARVNKIYPSQSGIKNSLHFIVFQVTKADEIECTTGNQRVAHQ